STSIKKRQHYYTATECIQDKRIKIPDNASTLKPKSTGAIMKIVCHREGLLAACQLVGVAAATKGVNPVLSNIKAVVEPDRCTLIGTDTEVGIRMEVRSIKVNDTGEALFPAARILSILREAPDEEVSIDAGPDTTMVRGKRAEFEMPGEDPSIFPDF